MKQLYFLFLLCLLPLVASAQLRTFDTFGDGANGFSTRPSSSGIIATEDYIMDVTGHSNPTASTYTVTRMFFVGGVTSNDGNGGEIIVRFFDAAGDFVTSLSFTLSRDGNLIYTLNIDGIINIPTSGSIAIDVDQNRTLNAGRQVQGQVFAANDPVNGSIGSSPQRLATSTDDRNYAFAIEVFDPALPVSFSALDVAATGKGLNVNWSTEFEDNNRGYHVERSLDGVAFTDVGFVAGAPNAASGADYEFFDEGVIENLTYFYRIRQEDFDGSVQYSDIVSGALRTDEVFSVSNFTPNPAEDITRLNVSVRKAGDLSVRLYDAAGREVLREDRRVSAGGNTVVLQLGQLPSGTYLARISTPGGSQTQRLIVK